MAKAKSQYHERTVLKPFYLDRQYVEPAKEGEQPVKVTLTERQVKDLASKGCVQE